MAATQQDCPTCEGFGKVAKSELPDVNGKSWLQFRGRHYFSEEMQHVREGTTEPVVCPQCNGSGKVDVTQPIVSASTSSKGRAS